MKNKILKMSKKNVLIIIVMVLFVSLALLMFPKQTGFIYSFKSQNYLMGLVMLAAFLKYRRNFYKFAKRVVMIFAGICIGINITGWQLTDKYQYIGLKAVWDNYCVIIIFSSVLFGLSFINRLNHYVNLKKNEEQNVVNSYYERFMLDNVLYDSHKHDAKYICKFLFESNLKTLGISGRYGSGKSIIMNKIINITSSRANQYVVISPLSCNIEEIPTYVVGQIERVLRNMGIYTNNTRQINDVARDSHLGLLINIINGNQTLSDLYFNLRELIKESGIKLTVVVDDLDRIYDKKQIQSIFTILDSIISDRCKVIYLYDASKLNKIFDAEGGSRYIEKYIQDEYILKNLTFKDLIKIENFNYIESHNTSQNESICEMINNEASYIEYGVKLYKYSGSDLKFDKYRLTPRLINKIITMTYERLSDSNYLESVKGYEKFVFRFYVFAFYFQDLKQQICGINSPSLYFRFKYCGKELTLEQVLSRFFNVGIYSSKWSTEKELFNEYVSFIHMEGNAEKLLALDLLGYSIDTFKAYIEHRSKIDIAEANATENEISYNRGYINLNYDTANNNRMFNNNKIAHIIANLVNQSISEYTDDEKFVKDFNKEVLNQTDMLRAFKNYKIEKYKDNYPTINIRGQDKFTSIFNSFKKGIAEDIYWNNLMKLYYEYLFKDNKIIFNDIVLTNINLFGFVSYRASMYAFRIISKFSYEDYENKYVDIPSIPRTMTLIKVFLETNFDAVTIFPYPKHPEYFHKKDIDECREYLQTFKKYLQRFIESLNKIETNVRNKFKDDILCIRSALNKLIDLVDKSHYYKDSIERKYIETTFRYLPRDISKYDGKSNIEIDKMIEDDINKNNLLPIDYKRIKEKLDNNEAL